DPDGKIISSNQAAVDIIGSESINEKIDAVIYSLSMDDFADIKAGKKTQYQEKIGEKTILFSFKPDEESDTVYVYGSDITSFVKLEEEMAEKAAFMRNNPAPVLHINYKGKIISYNPASMHVFGNNLSESAVSSIFPNIELEDLISLKEEEQIQLEMKDNESVYLFTFKNDSKTESIFIYGSDITSLKDAENRFKNITAGIEQAFDSIVITDIKGKITYVNPAFESITGYSKEEVVNKNPRLLKSGKQSYEFYMEMWQRITSGKIWQGDMINRKKSGDLYYEEMSIAPVKNENDEIINFIAIKRDVSDKKELENKLGRLRREHTAFMRHELNNMITPVKGFADILSSTEENLDDKQKSYVDKIRISSERIIHLIDSLKQLEDFEIEKFEIDRTDGELKNILDQSFNDVMILADENKVKINFEDKSENSIIPM
ncbi:MAG: PAS domain S-box protein, partial [bacterium]|nr:PAS domain S-box protein [bacterium]